MLITIIAACLVGGLLSLLVAAVLAFRLTPVGQQRLVAFAAGAMLAAALLDVLPEAIEMRPGDVDGLMVTLLVGVLAFYLLERLSLLRHDHGPAVAQAHAPAQGLGGHGHAHLRGSAWAVLLGDSVHNFVDGVLIAAAFLADPWLGVTTTLAIALHEIPQELGDFAVLLAAGWSRRAALLANAASSLSAVLGGILGWWTLAGAQALLPHALALAAASLLYIALADLVPWLHVRHRQESLSTQSLVLAAGVVCIPLAGHWLH